MDTNDFDSQSEDETPPGWEQKFTAGGKICYVNHLTKTMQWSHPRTGKKKCIPKELPFGWKKVICPDGSVLFSDEIRNFKTNTDPRLAFVYDKKEDPLDITFKFDACSTALEVLHGTNLSGRIAIVTGANTGIGFETARSLALYGCCVIFACRSMEKAEQAVAKVRSEKSYVNCVPMLLDLASLRSVENFVSSFKSQYKSLNILILNAAIFWAPFSLTEDAYESTFQICHLAHFHLTTLLEDRILHSYPARVVIVSCESHRFSNLSADNLVDTILFPENKSKLTTYANAKLCNLLFANELHTRWSEKGVEIFAVHPGNVVSSDLNRHCWWPLKLLYILCKPFCKTLQQAASSAVFCATSHSLENASGIYFNNCFPCPPNVRCKVPPLARTLWILSENMIKYFKQQQLNR